MRSVGVHAALLAVAIVLALVTWLREPPSALERERVLVWSADSADVALEWASEGYALRVERRGSDTEPYLWGVEVRASAGEGGADTLRYPLGRSGEDVVRSVVALRALRDLGAVPPERRGPFGLDRPHARLTLVSAGERREIEIGDSVFRSSDRYALDPRSGTAYVLPSEVVEPLRIGGGALRERNLHEFSPQDVDRVRVEGPEGSRTMRRMPAREGFGERWADPATPERPDQTFTNFVERLGQLAIADFDVAPPIGLSRLLRVDYLREDGAPLGFVELLRADDDGGFFVLSERTRVPARAVALLAERVAQDAVQIF